MSKYTKQEQENSVILLKKYLKPGDTLYTVLRHVSKSGMYRAIDCYSIKCVKGKVEKQWLSYLVAKAIRERFDERWEAIGVSGGGMDMGYYLMMGLSYTLHGHNPKGDGGKSPGVSPRPGHYQAGYSLNHEWI